MSDNPISVPVETPAIPRPVRPLPELPEERFWLRYSPHHELPLSSGSSVALHLLAIGLLLLAARFLLSQAQARWSPPNVEVVKVKPTPLPELQKPDGRGDSPNPGPATVGTKEPLQESVPPGPTPRTPEKPVPGQVPDLPVSEIDRTAFSGPIFQQNPAVEELIKRGNEATATIAALDQNLRAKLARALEQKGKGNPGPGVGPDAGPSAGSGRANLTLRQKRVLRWTLVFPRQNGEDYVRQLQYFSAILAVQDPEQLHELRLYRNLENRPVEGKIEDVSDLNRMFWIDRQPESVRILANTLGIAPTPREIVAFFPAEFEKRLLELEHTWLNKAEDEIEETRFKVVQVAPGKYEPQVTSQRLKR